MNETETESIEPIKYQLRKWREVANMHLPHTDCDRDDAAAIDTLIQTLESDNAKLRDDLDNFVGIVQQYLGDTGSHAARRAVVNGIDHLTSTQSNKQALSGSD